MVFLRVNLDTQASHPTDPLKQKLLKCFEGHTDSFGPLQSKILMQQSKIIQEINENYQDQSNFCIIFQICLLIYQ